MPYKDKTKDNACKRAWFKKNPEYKREWERSHSHGMSAEEYQERLDRQKGLCGLCHEPFDFSNKARSPVLDHDHQTEVRRDFLHSSCNLAIGLLRDNVVLCRLAVEYLERHKLEEPYHAS